MIKALSGPSGKVDGSKFVFAEVRSNFEYPRDKEIIVYFDTGVRPARIIYRGFGRIRRGSPYRFPMLNLRRRRMSLRPIGPSPSSKI